LLEGRNEFTFLRMRGEGEGLLGGGGVWEDGGETGGGRKKQKERRKRKREKEKEKEKEYD
jgi:hypothetical protein